MVRRLAAAILCSAALTAHADTALFDFDGPDSPINTETPFALTRSGLTGTFVNIPVGFSGSFVVGGPGDFPFATLTGNYLIKVRPSAAGNNLQITLSAPQTSVDLLFALSSPSVLSMFLSDGPTFVGSASASGSIPPGFLVPEGELSFSGPAFDQIVLSSVPFAIDDLRLEPAVPIPEPRIVWLLATGLLAVGGIARRRRR